MCVYVLRVQCVCVCVLCVSRQQSAQNPEHLSLHTLPGDTSRHMEEAKVMFNHLIHFPCMLSYRPKVRSGDFNIGKGIGDKEMSSCYGGLHIHRFVQWCL